jgi:hypothetical protein
MWDVSSVSAALQIGIHQIMSSSCRSAACLHKGLITTFHTAAAANGHELVDRTTVGSEYHHVFIWAEQHRV